MRKILYLLLLILPLSLVAQSQAGDFLDKAIAKMKADAALQMDYTYTVYDNNGKVMQADKGVMRLDGNKYSLLMNEIKVWCNGVTQWSYMNGIDEIYITDASSPEAQNLSPLYVMEMYKGGYKASLGNAGKETGVVLEALSPDANINKVKLCFDAADHRLKTMNIYISGQGSVYVVLDGYTSHCKFPDNIYECPVKEYSSAEIVDMR